MQNAIVQVTSSKNEEDERRFRGSKIFSRGYFEGQEFFFCGYFVGAKMFILDILWVTHKYISEE